MKKQVLLLLLILAVGITACSNMKKLANGNMVSSKLEGTWELYYITGPRIAFEGLYPEKKPFLKFDLAESRVSGNTSCNGFAGTLEASEQSISFNKMAVTQMLCEGNGESTFLKTLNEIDGYKLEGEELVLLANNIPFMKFKKTK